MQQAPYQIVLSRMRPLSCSFWYIVAIECFLKWRAGLRCSISQKSQTWQCLGLCLWWGCLWHFPSILWSKRDGRRWRWSRKLAWDVLNWWLWVLKRVLLTQAVILWRNEGLSYIFVNPLSALGLFIINGSTSFAFFRVPGVLQRFAICYAVVSPLQLAQQSTSLRVMQSNSHFRGKGLTLCTLCSVIHNRKLVNTTL